MDVKFDMEVCCTVVLQAEGHLHEAAQDIVNYVRGGFSALQYGTIKYLPCYAAAGLLIKLGSFNSLGEVWSSHALLMLKLWLQYQNKHLTKSIKCAHLWSMTGLSDILYC